MGRYIQQPVREFNPGITDTKTFYGSGQYRIFSSSGNWTVPTGVSTVRVSALGAGGGGGGHWYAQEDGGTCLSGICTSTFKGSFALGGAGGGGSYTVGVASVTPGCVCCVVVGAAGSTQDTCVKWANSGALSYCCCAGGDTGKLCAECGGAGGFSCALGICAPGGQGGGNGRCGCGGLDANIWSTTTNWGTYCSCIDAGCSGCICGGAGGSGSNGFVNYCGGAGGAGGWLQGIQGSSINCLKNFTNAGAAGSPLGHGNGPVTPNLFNSAAFDGSTDNEATLILKYDLPFPRWCGQIIYTQAAGTLGAPGNCSSVTCCCSCTYNLTSYCCCFAKSKWNAACSGWCCCMICSIPEGPYCEACLSKTFSTPGLGAGGTTRLIGAISYDTNGPVSCCRLRVASYPGTCAQSGEVILEW